MPRLELRLLGIFEARVAGNLVEFATRQSELLLAVLALEPERPHSREQLSALLWGDRSDEQARVSLRQAIYRLRQALKGADPFPLEIDARTVRLNPTSVWSDLAELEAADGSDPRQLERAVALCRGDLLDGLKGADPEVETWLLGERARVRRLTAARFSALAGLLRKERRIVEMEVLARRRLALDPYDEDALREVMSASVLQGRRNAALEAYREFAARLRADLSVNPAQETEALFRRIRSGEVAADPAAKLEPVGHAQPPTASVPDPDRVAMSERRYVTALHALLPGLARLVGEMDPEASMGLAGPVRDRLFRLVERHGGVIHQLGEDSLTAVFGTGAGTESSPIEAGRTALAILAEEPSAWIGLHAGEAVVGETSEVGAVALAARMLAEGAAAGSVLISKTASRLCEGYFEAEPGPPLPSTGLETVRLTGLSPARNSWQARAGRVLSPFRGRQDELAELHRGFARLDRGATVRPVGVCLTKPSQALPPPADRVPPQLLVRPPAPRLRSQHGRSPRAIAQAS